MNCVAVVSVIDKVRGSAAAECAQAQHHKLEVATTGCADATPASGCRMTTIDLETASAGDGQPGAPATDSAILSLTIGACP
jgi:hypothetical protein